MKIGFLTDSHFDESNRLDETVRAHAAAVEAFAAEQVTLLLHGGDIYERRSTPRERHAVADFLVAAADAYADTKDPGIDVAIVAGNHDAPGDIDLLARIDAPSIRIVAAERPRAELVADAAVVMFLPWPTKANLLAATGDAERVDDVLASMLRTVLRGLRAQADRLDPTRVYPRILLAHAMVDGSMTSSGQPLRGVPMRVSLSDFALADPDVVLLGHIHKAQAWIVDAEDGVALSTEDVADVGSTIWTRSDRGSKRRRFPVVYGGSVTPTTYGETEAKRVYVVTVSDHFGDRSVFVDPIDVGAAPLVLLTARFDAAASFHGFVFAEPRAPIPPRADVRVRYVVPFDQRDRARAAEEGYRDAILASGAGRVTFEASVLVESVARAPEIAAARTIAEKVDALRVYRGETIEPDRAAALAARLVRYEAEVDATATAPNRAACLRFRRIVGRGVGVLRGFDVDLDAIPGPVIAVAGPNGAGKSTFLESFLIGTYRTTATRDAWRDLATDRGSFVRVDFAVDGVDWSATQHMDAVSKKAESSLTGADGFAVLPDTKVTTYDRWSERNLPPWSLLTASSVAPQGSVGFLGSSPADRRAVILGALGIDRMESLAVVARADAAAAKVRLAIAEGVLAAATARAATDYDPAARVDAAREDLARWHARVESDRAEYDRVAAAHRAWGDASAERNVRINARNAAADRLDRSKAAYQRVREEFDAARARRAAVAETSPDGAAAVLDVARADYAAATVAEADARAARASAVVAHANATTAAAQVGVAVAMAERRARECRAAVDALARLTAVDVPAAEAAVAAAEADVERWNAAQHDAAGRRIVGLRTGLKTISDGVLSTSPATIAEYALIADDRLASDAARAPEEYRQARRTLDIARAGLATARTDAERRRRIEEDAAEAVAAEMAFGEAIARRDAAVEAANAALATRRQREADEEAARRDLEAARLRLASAERCVAANDELARLDGTIEAMRKRVDDAGVAMAEAKNALDACPEPGLEPAYVGPPSREVIDHAERAARAATAELAAAEAALAAIVAAREDVATAQAAVDAARSEFEDATRLANELGRTGIQAHEIDAAGPRLSAVANELLRACYGPRWQVRFATTRPPKDDPDGVPIECYEIEVADADTGTVRAAGSYSGGERTILSEAIGLALTAFAVDRTGATAPTLIRDESAAALDAGKAEPYVEMLRRAAAILGGSKVLLVSHSDAVRAACDDVLTLADGGAS